MQVKNTAEWIAAGRRIVGRKVGLTAKAVQLRLGFNQPYFGVKFDDREIADGSNLSSSQVLQLKVEAEIAFIMGAAIEGPHVTEKAAKDYGLDTRSILIELGRRKMVGGQDDMIVDVALDMTKAAEQRRECIPVLSG